MKKNSFKFEVSFNLNTDDNETLDMESIKGFHKDLKRFVLEWPGKLGYFYTYSKDSDGESFPTSIKVKKIKEISQSRTTQRRMQAICS
jgi:hypothetical protein